ncbi:DNA cross-link repair protein pso2/snm1 [Mycena polygramma]|nr:DNA cross-link repair protein pso2/snm1 [Mycena polygramma]
MAPQKKGKKSKTKDKGTVTTLHKFFTSPGATPAKKANAPTKKSTPASKAKSAPNPKDIIVIDSDSDVEVAAVRAVQKKRRRSESSSDIELLPGPSIKRVNAVASTSAAPAFPVAVVPALSFGKPSALLSQSPAPAAPTTPSLSFGAPSALLAGGPSVTANGAQLFGRPSLLLPSVSSKDDCPSPATETDACTRTDLGDEDDWGMGDDEMGANPDDDDDDTTQIDEPNDIAVSLCPLCEKILDELSETERGDHVNACLDGAAGAEPGSSKVPLKRLSTLPVPSALASRARKSGGSNAFAVLMTSRTEMAVWNEATEAETSRATKKIRRKAPFYKVMQGMPIAVDAFRYGDIPRVTAYFLTHAHSDHYTNLSSSWKHGPIYCSEGTANLIIHILSVDKKWVHPLPMDVATVIPNTGGVHVTLIEANHCPGSCLFLFEGPQTVDAGDSTFKSPFVGSSKTFPVKGKHMDHVYLDTTYLDPKYSFPPQPLVISACAELAKRVVDGKVQNNSAPKMNAWLKPPSISDDLKGKQKARPERILMVVGTYSVGKERIVKAVAQAVNSKIYCDSRKAGILRCQPDPELHALLTADPLAADQYLGRFKGSFTKVVGFRPTGWTFRPPAGAVQSPTIASVISHAQQKAFTHANLRPAHTGSASVELFPVPYSEHSSFFELTCFALSLQWGRMIATVNVGSERSRAKMTQWMQKWEAEKKKRKKGEAVPHRRFDHW